MYAQLIFSLSRYEAVIDAYLDGLEASGLSDLSRVTSVASFFVSRVDTLIDKLLEKIGTPEALDLRGKVPTTCSNFSTPFRMQEKYKFWIKSDCCTSIAGCKCTGCSSLRSLPKEIFWS